jgi:hypothetical protein
MDTDVSWGLASFERDSTAGKSSPPTVTKGDVGLMGVAGRPWLRYQTKTARC